MLQQMSSITDPNNNSNQTMPPFIRNSSAVDDMEANTDPMLYDPVVEAQSSSSHAHIAVDAREERRPPRIPLDPVLYNAVVNGNVEVLDDFLQSQDLHQLDGVTIGHNTVLHIAAKSNRDLTWQRGIDHVDFAREVYQRNRSVLTACNRLKETPLHCAAKAGNYRMVFRLISFAAEEDQAVKQTLLTARNMHGETALHEAVRVGHSNIVNQLILSEPGLTGIVDAEGVSPLYLATMMNALNIVEIFTKQEPSGVSCAGPKGQTALHIAVLECTRITRTLLEWNKSLATKVDHMKSTPLHYAASVGNLETVKLLLGDGEIKKTAHMADKNGLYPIHTAAKCCQELIIRELIEQFPDSDELLDTQGRNYIHLAIQSSSLGLGDSPQERRPPQIPIDPKLYDAVVEGNVKVLDDFLQSQDLLVLDGVTIGDNTVLHIAASSNRDLTWQGTSDNVDFAREVYHRNRSLLMACNRLKETPLHCAAKAGNYRMVSRLISFAEEEDHAVKQTLVTARNIHGETALHEAVRFGHGNIVDKLILSEPSITGIVDADGVSPLYLATMMNAVNIVEIFTKEEPSRVSCAGPKGQTALHVAVLEYPRIVRPLLEWNKSLATKVDDKKSTPLHYAASVGNLKTVKLLLGDDEIKKAAYMADKNGLFPIHTAAKCGNALTIKELIKQFPDSDELLDKKGRNFLHIAILSGKGNIIVHMGSDNHMGLGLLEAMRTFRVTLPMGDYFILFYFFLLNPMGGYNHTFLRMLNARDDEGNTPLHLAGKTRQYGIVRFLISMKMVYSSIMNRNGLTPVDLALKQLDLGFGFISTAKHNILRCMMWTGALPSPRRADHMDDDLEFTSRDEKREIKNIERTTQNLSIISVLIATVTFAASFTMPGGYIADDHMNRGTPILSRKYAFKAFIVADSLAFFLSIFVTTRLLFAGSDMVDMEFRTDYLRYSTNLMEVACKATICAFALAIYTMLYQVNLGISILVFVASFGLLPFSNPFYSGRVLLLAPPIVNRIGCRGLFKYHLGPWTSMHNNLKNPWIIRYKFFDYIFFQLLLHISLYGLIFGLALIL